MNPKTSIPLLYRANFSIRHFAMSANRVIPHLTEQLFERGMPHPRSMARKDRLIDDTLAYL
jgi:hypothetical protein